MQVPVVVSHRYLKIVSKLCSQVSSDEFNPLIKYSQTGVTIVIIIGIVVEEDIEGEKLGGFGC